MKRPALCLFTCLLWLATASLWAQQPADLAVRAANGDAAAQVALGEQFAAAHDFKQAIDWYSRAAANGSLPAIQHLAALYRDGGGKWMQRDVAQAVVWYRKAAELGDAASAASLGTLYSFGMGIARDDREAYFWFDVAASLPGPNQEKYIANRQMVGQHITADELETLQDRLAQWKTAHPRR